MSQNNCSSQRHKTKLGEVIITAPLGDIITSHNCSKLVSEIIKYILYRKQQIPYPFDDLQIVATRNKSESPAKATQTQRRVTVSMERQNRQAVRAYDALQTIFQNLEGEFDSSGSDSMKEVVLLLGSTPVSPQEIYRIILPSLAIHCDAVGISLRRSLLHLIRHFTNSCELNNILDQTMPTTNTYVLLKKDRTNEAASWFLPKDRYSLPTRGRQVTISLEQLISTNVDHLASTLLVDNSLPSACKFIVHQDEDVISLPQTIFASIDGVLKDSKISQCSVVSNSNELAVGDGVQWFQSRHFLKGFTS